ncbi:MAG: M1 family aminopeptidase [Bacteroidota bacterium]|jgi:hypothetical protein
MRKYFLILLIPFFCISQKNNNCQISKSSFSTTTFTTAQENLRSDTADVLLYDVTLNLTDFTTDTIRGYTMVKFNPKLNGLNYLCLDLLKMKIDSIKLNNSILNYSYNDTLLNIFLGNTYNIVDTLNVYIYYHGKPVKDASGWGGWYKQSGYMYNLGVGFDASPHVYGRVWHPCFDNFSERAKYTFHISTNAGKIAYCNGALSKDTTDAMGLRTRTWVMNEEIPSYLASISVANYTHVSQQYNGINGNIPIILAALPADTTNLKNSFIHLQDALSGFEDWYGPYVWNRVGYCLVPFNSGAMEHATNIAYPRATANGSLTYEADLMAHELSHHWWGDHTTCETAGDMWLNEGIASYSEYLFRDFVYGWQSYINAIKTNHEDMVHFAHLREGSLNVSGVPHIYTYGDHVYRKGADMMHNARAYLGDSLFKLGMKAVQQQKGFKNLNTLEFGNILTAATGVNMNQFMGDWILQPGWPHFSIDSTNVVPQANGTYNVTVYIKQKLARSQNFYTNVPLEITFKNNLWQNQIRKVFAGGSNYITTFNLPFYPVFTGINVDSKISDATSSCHKTVYTTGSNSFNPANLSLNIINIPSDSAWIRVEHNFVSPDTIKNNINNYRLNTQHYWKIDGIFDSTFHSKATFWYDGRKNLTGQTAYLDTCLTQFTSDSVLLLYRKNTSEDWVEVSNYAKTKLGGTTGKFGYFVVDTLKKGEYATANGVSSLFSGIKNSLSKKKIRVYPNPANQESFFISTDSDISYRYELSDLSGRRILTGVTQGKVTKIDVHQIETGTYIVLVDSGNEPASTTKIILTK